MIRCYEARLPKTLHYRITNFLSKKWLDRTNTYGIELKKYCIISPLSDTILGLYIKDPGVFGDNMLVDNYFSDGFAGNIISIRSHHDYSFFTLCKRRILKFFPIDYEEQIIPEDEMYSGFTMVAGLFRESNRSTVMGVAMGNTYQVNKIYRNLFYNIWISNVEGKKKKPTITGVREI